MSNDTGFWVTPQITQYGMVRAVRARGCCPRPPARQAVAVNPAWQTQPFACLTYVRGSFPLYLPQLAAVLSRRPSTRTEHVQLNQRELVLVGLRTGCVRSAASLLHGQKRGSSWCVPVKSNGEENKANLLLKCGFCLFP